MKVLITGVCGFVGSTLASALIERVEGIQIHGIDNLMRPGSELNRAHLARLGVKVVHGDIRMQSDVDALPGCDWVIDAAANPSVLAGIGGGSRQLFEHNLASLVNVLEYARAHRAGVLLLSSSRVYSIDALAAIPLVTRDNAFALDTSKPLATGLGEQGIGAGFSTAPPISLYGATKLASETMALEYGLAFDLPVWITRCGVLAGAGQFGTPDQGIFAFWLNAHRTRRPMRYTGFGGLQARDAFHPRDLAELLLAQMRTSRNAGQRVYTAGGGVANCMSLRQLTAWCDARFGAHEVAVENVERRYDVPWVAMDNSDATRDFGWTPRVTLPQILEEIAQHAEAHPDWLDITYLRR